MSSLLTTHGFGLWWRLAKDWFTSQHNAIKAAVANVDLTSVTSAVASAKNEILAAMPQEASDEDIDAIFMH